MQETSVPTVILVADDDADIRAMIAGSLELSGFQVIQACDGREAVKRCETALPDIALLDGNMPHLSGFEVCGSIKRLAGGALVPVIILTAMDSVDAKVEAFKGGADDYLTKPFHFRELQARISAQLRLRELNLKLQEQNSRLQAMQAALVEQERQLAVTQLAGTAAHQLGQPLSAMMLNCHLLKTMPAGAPHFSQVVQAIEDDLKRMRELIERLRAARSSQTQEYYGASRIIDLERVTK